LLITGERVTGGPAFGPRTDKSPVAVFFLVGDSPASEFYVPTFRDTLSIFIGGVKIIMCRRFGTLLSIFIDGIKRVMCRRFGTLHLHMSCKGNYVPTFRDTPSS